MDLCHVCWDNAKFACSGCNKSVYCSEHCQAIAWNSHKIQCGKPQTPLPILWVRGTNTTIFLSCYRNTDGWFLMSKGDQFRKGFVPMSETIDPGITSIAGVNYDFISANPPAKFEESMNYALRAVPFRYMETVSELVKAEYMELVKAVFLLMRLKQYDGEVTPIVTELTKTITSRDWFQKQLQEINDTLVEFKKIKKLLFAKIERPSPEISREDYIAFQNDIRKQFDLPYHHYLSLDKGSWLRNMLKNPTGEFYRWIANAYNRKEFLVTRIIMVKSFLEEEEYADVFAHIVRIMNGYKKNIKVFMNLYQKTIDPISPVFEVTKNDEIILEDPIPLIIASRNASTNGKPHRTDVVNSEINLPSPIEIGNNGANVIFVRKSDEGKLLLLLKRIGFSIADIEIFTDYPTE